MKKFLVILMALAMVLSASAFASAADSSVLKFTGTERADSMDCIQYNINAPFSAGDTVSFEFKPALLDGWGGINVRSESAGEKWFYVVYKDGAYSIEMKDGASRPADADVSFAELGDGWVKVTFKSAADGNAFFIRNEWATNADVDVASYVVYMDNITVAGKTCSCTASNAVEFADNSASLKFDDGTEFTITRSSQLKWVAAIDGVAPTGGDTTGGDTTGGDTTGTTATPKPASTSTTTTKTGVVSAAVVAAAAVLGGAVVLKKKEF